MCEPQLEILKSLELFSVYYTRHSKGYTGEASQRFKYVMVPRKSTGIGLGSEVGE